MVSVPGLVPINNGVKVTSMVQRAPTKMGLLSGQVDAKPYSPSVVMLAMVSGSWPLLVTMMICG